MAEKKEPKTSEQLAAAEPVGPKPVPKRKPARKPARKKKKSPKKKKPSARKPIKKRRRLTAEMIEKQKDIREEELQIEEWDGSVIVRGLSSVAHEKLVQSSMEGPMGARTFNMVGYQAKLACLCAYDDYASKNGNRIFEDKHATMLMEKASGPVSKIAQKAQELSGLGGAALERLRANLELMPSGDLATD